jgi:hypothetical protein
VARQDHKLQLINKQLIIVYAKKSIRRIIARVIQPKHQAHSLVKTTREVVTRLRKEKEEVETMHAALQIFKLPEI